MVGVSVFRCFNVSMFRCLTHGFSVHGIGGIGFQMMVFSFVFFVGVDHVFHFFLQHRVFSVQIRVFSFHPFVFFVFFVQFRFQIGHFFPMQFQQHLFSLFDCFDAGILHQTFGCFGSGGS